MPSSPGYSRNYTQEYKTAKERGEIGTGSNSRNAKRHRLRRLALKKGMVKPGQDLDHKTPLSKGGSNTLKNARAASPSDNRSFPRNKDGSMKSNKYYAIAGLAQLVEQRSCKAMVGSSSPPPGTTTEKEVK